MRTILRPLDDEVGRGEVGGQGACITQGGDGLFDVVSDLAAELEFHGVWRSGFCGIQCNRRRGLALFRLAGAGVDAA